MDILKNLFTSKQDQQIVQARAQLAQDEAGTFTRLRLQGLERALRGMDKLQAKSVLNAFKSLLQLKAEGEHMLYINNIHYQVTFKNGALIAIEEV
jgi:hypothetical protein